MNRFVANPWRVLLGTLAAPFIAALATEIPTFHFVDYWIVALLGLLSVVTLYLPLVLWRLQVTRHPFCTCVIVGGFCAPGWLGYGFGAAGAAAAGAPLAMLFVAAILFPLGAIGGAVFWLCAVRGSEGFAQA